MKLSRGARRCLKTLQSYLGGKNHCWPSQKTLAREMRCSVRSIKRYISELRGDKTGVRLVTSARTNRNSVYTYTLAAELAPRLSPRIVTSKAIYPNMNLKPSEQESRKPPQMETQLRPRYVWEPDPIDPAELEAHIEQHMRRQMARAASA